jgi:hypothetical protein
MSEENKQTGVEKFKEKYSIDYDDLIVLPIKNTEIYKQNYKILYDKKTDQCFSLWSSPYRHFIYIENEGFITLDTSLREANDDYIKEHFKLE